MPGDTNRLQDVFVRDRVAGVTERVSVGPAGAQANGRSLQPAISANGRYVAFTSAAGNLVPGDRNRQLDVFVRDRVAGVTRRVSVGKGGVESDERSFDPAISADGRYVAFVSVARNLAPGDTNGLGDVYVRDRVAHETRWVSVGRGGAQANDKSRDPAISAHGRYVAFDSVASNLAPGDTNGMSDVFVRDRVAHKTRWVSRGRGAFPSSFGPAISADGRYVAFVSEARNLVPGDTNRAFDVFLRNRVSGVTRRVSVGQGGAQANGDSFVTAISADARYVAFASEATNLVTGDTNGVNDVFLRGPLQ